MTKKDLVEKVSAIEGLSKSQIERILDTAWNMMFDTLVKGEEVKIRNFGTFSVTTRAGRPFKNPKTKKESELPKRKCPIFIPSRTLKDGVAKGELEDE